MSPQSVRVTLTEAQRRDAWEAARVTRAWAVAHGGRDSFATTEPLLVNMRGYCAEIAAPVVLGVPWLGARPETRHAGDLANGTEVRSTEWPNGRLLIHRDDDVRRPYVLVTGRSPHFMVRGWMRGHEAQRREWWWPNAPHRPCWAVPQPWLWKLEDLCGVLDGVLIKPGVTP